MEIKRYQKMTRFILEELEEYGATYAEAYEALEGAKRQLDERLKTIKLDGRTNGI